MHRITFLADSVGAGAAVITWLRSPLLGAVLHERGLIEVCEKSMVNLSANLAHCRRASPYSQGEEKQPILAAGLVRLYPGL
jgi:hypothetical protein